MVVVNNQGGTGGVGKKVAKLERNLGKEGNVSAHGGNRGFAADRRSRNKPISWAGVVFFRIITFGTL